MFRKTDGIHKKYASLTRTVSSYKRLLCGERKMGFRKNGRTHSTFGVPRHTLDIAKLENVAKYLPQGG